MQDLRALTVIQPWASAIAHYGKRVENRSWPPPRWLVGQTLAIHAGKRWGRDEHETLEDLVDDQLMPRPEGALVLGAIVAVVTVDGWVRGSQGLLRPHIEARHGQLGLFDDEERAMLEHWFLGPIGWMLSSVRPLAEPVLCKGAQGLWRVPPDVAAEVERQVRRAA